MLLKNDNLGNNMRSTSRSMIFTNIKKISQPNNDNNNTTTKIIINNINENVSLDNNIDIDGDISANNINLMGDMISSNSQIVQDLDVGGIINANNIALTSNLNAESITTNTISTNDIITNNINCDILKSPTISTPLITSLQDLILEPSPNYLVRMPNMICNIIKVDAAILPPDVIKSAKTFLLNKTLILNADATCDGIELVLINTNASGNIIIRDSRDVITSICGNNAIKIVFSAYLAKWFKLC
jgi:hypothetical protein